MSNRLVVLGGKQQLVHSLAAHRYDLLLFSCGVGSNYCGSWAHAWLRPRCSDVVSERGHFDWELDRLATLFHIFHLLEMFFMKLALLLLWQKHGKSMLGLGLGLNDRGGNERVVCLAALRAHRNLLGLAFSRLFLSLSLKGILNSNHSVST